jgi:hypothetical protein
MRIGQLSALTGGEKKVLQGPGSILGLGGLGGHPLDAIEFTHRRSKT